MYENLGLKNEYINNLRNYTILVFTAGDLNKLKDLFIKYDYLDVSNKLVDGKVNINKAESITNLLGYLDENQCRQNGIEPEVYQSIQMKKRMK